MVNMIASIRERRHQLELRIATLHRLIGKGSTELLEDKKDILAAWRGVTDILVNLGISAVPYLLDEVERLKNEISEGEE